MRYKRRAAATLTVLTAGALLLAGCSSSGSGGTKSSSSTSSAQPAFNAAVTGYVNPSTKKGGTLKLLASSDCDSWDPARTYYGYCWNMQRLFTRTLVGYSQVNNSGPFKLSPDLATGLGQHSADFKTWTYTLQPNLKYSDGSAITPADIKYEIGRIYATDVINGGPTFYYTGILNVPSSYKGVYKSGELPDSAVSVSGQSITFHLKKPFADFDYLMALPTAAPVPDKKENGAAYTGATYTKNPISSGPFVFGSYTPNKSVTFTRNQYWQQSTDKIRKPLVDTVDFTIDSDPNDIDAKLKAGTADAKADNVIGTTLQAQVLSNPKLKAYADDGAGDSLDYLVIPSSVIPNVHCRAAIFYATNKAGLLSVRGGAAAGEIAGSFTPPGIPGHDPKYNPYPVGSDNQGDVAKAKSELQACGKPNGFTTNFAYSTPSETGPKIYQTEKAALARVGITLNVKTAAASSYYSTFAGSPANVKSQELGIINAGWGADFPTDYGFYNNIVNGSAILPTGNSNYGSINDPTINSILDNTGTPVDQATGEKLNHALMATASDLPYIWGKYLYYRNPRMTNVTANFALAFGIYDFVNVGVQ
ncbi:MAG TPA: ABC transporter substrate-binding protein [Amnibacterium sp.]|jgi:peptide/nickel transport system substrate-binding protein|uniref:ABC transporter substrate-binding protein n=1 Tax=Amnibacterium sp. TaxID=1872496 RepID=UPI002F9365DE